MFCHLFKNFLVKIDKIYFLLLLRTLLISGGLLIMDKKNSFKLNFFSPYDVNKI